MSNLIKNFDKYHPAGYEFKKENFPFYWLVQTTDRYNIALEKILKKLNLDLKRYRILFSLKEKNILNISDIAFYSLCKMPTATKIIYRMQNDGLLITQVNELDARVTLVSLTEKGKAIISEIEEKTKNLFINSFNGIEENQLIQINQLLKLLYDNLPEP